MASSSAVVAETIAKLDRVTEKDIDFPIPDALFLQQWSCVPVVCVLHEKDSIDDKSKRCQFIVPRQSYLFHYTYTETIATSISNFARGGGCRWFSYRCLLYPKSEIYFPLPIQFPVHVLCDLVAAERGGSGQIPAFRPPLHIRMHFSEPKKEEYEAMCATLPAPQAKNLPTWEMYFQRYNEVLHLDNNRSGHRWNRHILKQSLFARYASCQALQVVERDLPRQGFELINAVVNNQADAFWKARCSVEQCGEMKSQSDECHLVVIHYNSWQSQLIVCKSSNQKLGLFLREKCSIFAKLEREHSNSNQPAHVVFVQGVNPLLSTPMDALLELFSSTDLCLHIVLKSRESVEQYVALLTDSKAEGR